MNLGYIFTKNHHALVWEGRGREPWDGINEAKALPTFRPTDKLTKIRGYRVACTQLKLFETSPKSITRLSRKPKTEKGKSEKKISRDKCGVHIDCDDLLCLFLRSLDGSFSYLGIKFNLCDTESKTKNNCRQIWILKVMWKITST